MMFKTGSAQERLDQAENWSGRATLIILAGIALEILVVLGWIYKSPHWDKWFTIIANALIGLGLVAEYICIRTAIRASGELTRSTNQKLTQALDRAVKAETDLVNFRKPRRSFIRPNIASTAEKLRSFSGTQFDIAIGGGGEEADCAWDIEEMLQTAGWSQLPWGVHAVGVNVIHRGPQRPLAGIAAAQNVEIHLDQQKQVILAPAAAALVVALNDLGVEAQIVPPNIANTNTDAVHILVGPKR